FECKVNKDDYNGNDGLRINASSVFTLQEARETFARRLNLQLNPKHDIAKIHQLLAQYRDLYDENRPQIPLNIHYSNQHAQADLHLNSQWRVTPKLALFEQLHDLLGEHGFSVGW
ncbi:MAG: DNA polymerase III subunit alpha, partial [Neisseria sp.]|nr:DNA polymerase III subunit alpha [Neisseria sp.]